MFFCIRSRGNKCPEIVPLITVKFKEIVHNNQCIKVYVSCSIVL